MNHAQAQLEAIDFGVVQEGGDSTATSIPELATGVRLLAFCTALRALGGYGCFLSALSPTRMHSIMLRQYRASRSKCIARCATSVPGIA
eukprot:2156993-Rhodomonas_salina.1